MFLKIDLTEYLIAFSTVMLLLSFISERLSNLIKLSFQNFRLFIPFPHAKDGRFRLGLHAKIKILANKKVSRPLEKVREFRIMTINIIIGFLIAVLVNANFFQILDSITNVINPDNTDTLIQVIPGWQIDSSSVFLNFYKSQKFYGAVYLLLILWSVSLLLFNNLKELPYKISPLKIKIPFLLTVIVFPFLCLILNFFLVKSGFFDGFLTIVYHVTGFFITGLFLSLGSKFWHDFLDFLFKVKNTQQKLSDPKTLKGFNSSDDLMNYANTSHYEIADKLYKAYKDQFWGIEGVVSVGMNSELDNATGFFKEVIEVEFTTAEAQNELLNLKRNESIDINANVFYLKDYLKLIHTEGIEVLSGFTHNPVCYGYNSVNPNNKGTFSLYEDQGRLMARSNLHVFALNSELRKHYKEATPITSKQLKLVIDNTEFDADIHMTKFGDGIYDNDYANAEVNLKNASKEEILRNYKETINYSKITNIPFERMRMFGAVTKDVVFRSSKHKTECKINYGSFYKRTYLYKINPYSHTHVNKGDSGSVVYFKDLNDNLKKGMLVAKSNQYAYMFLLNETM